MSNIDLDEVPVTLINTASGLEALTSALATATSVAVDTETEYREELTVDGIPGRVRVAAFGVRLPDGSEHAYVVDLRDVDPVALAPIMESVHAIGWNANFDEHALGLVGLRVGSWWDAMLADAATRQGRSGVVWYRSLAEVASKFLGVEMSGKGSTQLSYDSTSDLDDEQVRYAGLDTIITLRVADHIQTNVVAAGLVDAVELAMGARPFINAMMMNGVPFDFESYLDSAVASAQKRATEALVELAELTESRIETPTQQLGLFDSGPAVDLTPRVVPSWNPDSKPELVKALNRWSRDHVVAYKGRELLLSDSLVKNELKQIGGPVVSALLRYKSANKEVTTYGDDLRRFWRGGRFFSRYKQNLVSTNRLASFDFNAQNMSKGMLSYMRPSEGRVFVYGDISQAELRFLACFAEQQDMIEAFASGEDFHLATARIMNPSENLDALAENDPAAFKKMRTAAKALNFGIPYGMAAGLLSSNLTVSGVPTSKEDAQNYLDAYFAARPRVAEWLRSRDRFVDELAANLPQLDWSATLELYELFTKVAPVRKAMKRELGRLPSPQEVVQRLWPSPAQAAADEGWSDLSDEGLNAWKTARITKVAWAFEFDTSVVLCAGGERLEYEARTASGQRRLFNVTMDPEGNDQFSGAIVAAVLDMCQSRREAGQGYVRGFAERHGLDLPSPGDWKKDRRSCRVRVVKSFEGAAGKALKWEFVKGAIDTFGLPAMIPVLNKAASECVRASRNQYRNLPIQGSVADVMSMAFALVMRDKPASAQPVLSVHDSLVLEVDEADAQDLAIVIARSVEAAMARFCPGVTCKVDVDIRRSLADDDVIWELSPTLV